jgi:uncharacterized protein YbaP (TraB family)
MQWSMRFGRTTKVFFGWVSGVLIALLWVAFAHASEPDADVFWKISKDGKTSYAFGIMHTAGLSDVPAPVIDRLRSSRIFMREAVVALDRTGDLSDMLHASSSPQSVYRSLSPGAAKKLKVFWSQVPKGFLLSLEFYKPGAVLFILTQSLSVLDQAVKRNIKEGKILEFDTPEVVTEVTGRSLDDLMTEVARNAGVVDLPMEKPGKSLKVYSDEVDAPTLSRYIMKHVPSMSAVDLLRITQIKKLPPEWRRAFELRESQQELATKLTSSMIEHYSKADGLGALNAYMEKFSVNHSVAEDLETLRPKVLRHKLWLDVLLGELEKGNVFIGTGLGHLLSRSVYPNEPSLVDLLRQKGYEVTAVTLCESRLK